MRALRAFSSMDAMADFHAPFQSWPASAHPLDWSYEGTIEAIYTACLQPGDAAIDGGANQGRHTGPMAGRVQQRGLVIAVDANPAMIPCLRDRFPSPPVRPLFAALGAGTEDLEFSIALSDPGRSSLHVPPALTQIDRIRVPQVRIDDLETGSRRLRFIKLDLEGGEYGALSGAEERLRSDRPVICLEHIPRYMSLFGVGYDAYFALFERCGYRLVDILGTAFDRQTAAWPCWKPHYLVALPEDDPALADQAMAALQAYTARIYAHIPTWSVAPA